MQLRGRFKMAGFCFVSPKYAVDRADLRRFRNSPDDPDGEP